MERSVSSFSTEYLVVETTDIHSSTSGADAPIVVPIGLNDQIIAEPVPSLDRASKPACIGPFGASTAEVNADSSAVIEKVESVKQKFVIVSGKVIQRPAEIPKQVALPVIRAAESQSSVPPAVFRRFFQVIRKKPKAKRRAPLDEKEAAAISDGWSTEDEEEDLQTSSHVDGKQGHIPGMMTYVSVPKPAQVFRLSNKSNTYRKSLSIV